MWSEWLIWPATITTIIINMKRSEDPCLPKPKKNLPWMKVKLTLNQSHLPLQWRWWWLKMCKCCNLKVQVVILVGLPIKTPGMGANLANKISPYQIQTHTASIINICFIIFTSHKGTFHLRFSGIRPLRGGGYPPFPLRKKTFFFSDWFSVKRGGGYPLNGRIPLKRKWKVPLRF